MPVWMFCVYGINSCILFQDSRELSPEEIKIRELEKNISELDDQSSELQQFWLRQESHIVTVSQNRTDLLQQLSVLRKRMYFSFYILLL